MSSVINFLEGLGRRAKSLPDASFEEAIAVCSYAEQQALLAGDSDALARLIGARVSLMSAVAAPDNEPVPDERPEEPGEFPDDDESQAA